MARRIIGLGGVLLIGAAAGFVVLPDHKPGLTVSRQCAYVACRTGLSRSLYDALRITTWAFLIAGALLVTVGLIRRARSTRRAQGARSS